MPKNDLQLVVTLPERVAYEANSSQLDGKPLVNPAIAGPVLTYPLGSRPGDWKATLRFRAILPGNGESGTLSSKATITGDGITDAGKPMPVAENVLRRVKEQDHFRMPEFVCHPHFPTFSAELSAETGPTSMILRASHGPEHRADQGYRPYRQCPDLAAQPRHLP